MVWLLTEPETVAKFVVQAVAEPETVAEFTVCVVVERETVLELMAKSLQSLKLSRNSRCVSS